MAHPESFGLADRDGKFGMGKVLLLLVIAVGVWAVVIFAPPYLENFKFQKAVASVARHAKIEADDNVLLNTLQKEADQLGIRLPAEQIRITRRAGNTGIEVVASYKRQVQLRPLSKIVELDFTNDASERF